MSECAGTHRVRIIWINYDPPDSSCLFQTHLSPCLTRVGGFVDPVANRDMAADPCFASPGPDDVGVRGRHRQRPDGRNRLVVEDRRPMRAAVDGFPNSARGRADVVDVWLTGHARDRGRAVADRPDITPTERAEYVFRFAGRRLL